MGSTYMPKLNMTIPHQLTQAEALKRIQSHFGEIKYEFGDKISNFHEEWKEYTGTFSFSVMGFSVSGTMSVKPSEVRLSGNLPLAATLLKGKLESTIRERAKTLLA
jgi:hypothetical protein